MSTIAEAFREVKERVAQAAQRSGRQPEDVVLVAVTKTRPLSDVEQVIAAGARDLGENYVQELVSKQQALTTPDGSCLRWHLIGHLQRNKVKYVVPGCHLIHTVDSERLAEEVARRASAASRPQPVLLEVNMAGEESKYGVAPAEAAPLAEHVAGLAGVQLRGLMTMTPYGAPADEARRLFAGLRELAQRLQVGLPAGSMAELSMGMTQDYEIAIEEGATLVRVGTAIFGQRLA